MHGIFYGETNMEKIVHVDISSTTPSSTWSMPAIRETFSNASNAFVNSHEGRILKLKAEVTAQQEADRLIPIIQSNLQNVATLGGFGTTVYPRTTTVSDSMFPSSVNIFDGFYVRGSNVQIFNAPCILDELRQRLGNGIYVQGLSYNAIYVGLEPYPYRR